MADPMNVLEAQPGAVSRRKVVIGTAWAVPTIMTVGAAPAFAAVSTTVTINAVKPYAYGGTTTITQSAPATTFPVSGTGTSGRTVLVTVSDTSGTTPGVTASAIVQPNGTWSVGALNLSGLVDGPLTIKAKIGFAEATTSTIKDTVAPLLTRTSVTTERNKKSGTLSGAAGTAVFASNDLPVVVAYSSTFMAGTATTTATTWSVTWTWTGTGNANAGGEWVYISQSDEAGNITRRGYQIPPN